MNYPLFFISPKLVRNPQTGKKFRRFFAKVLYLLSLMQFGASQFILLSKPVFWADSNRPNPAFFRRRNHIRRES